MREQPTPRSAVIIEDDGAGWGVTRPGRGIVVRGGSLTEKAPLTAFHTSHF